MGEGGEVRIPFYSILPLSLAPLLCIVAGASVTWDNLFSSSLFLPKKLPHPHYGGREGRQGEDGRGGDGEGYDGGGQEEEEMKWNGQRCHPPPARVTLPVSRAVVQSVVVVPTSSMNKHQSWSHHSLYLADVVHRPNL